MNALEFKTERYFYNGANAEHEIESMIGNGWAIFNQWTLNHYNHSSEMLYITYCRPLVNESSGINQGPYVFTDMETTNSKK